MSHHTASAAKPKLMHDAANFAGMLLALVALILFFGWKAESFLSLTNLRTIANQIPTLMIVAVGMTFVLISGGIDLSVGSMLALSSATLGVLLSQTACPFPLALLACIGVGLACGLLNGAIVAHWRIPSFIVTLGMLEAARGGTYLITQSQTQYIGAAIDGLHEWSFLGLSLPFLLALLIVVAGHVLLTRTLFGRHLIATGHNEEVARLAGLPTRRIRLTVFGLCGALTGLAAILHTARLSAAGPNAGIGFELEAIAAAVIGGTSLAGGHGSVLRSSLGVLIIAVLGSGLAQINADDYAKRLITGVVIVAAVILDRNRQRVQNLS
jgi:ribose transport system permease protein